MRWRAPPGARRQAPAFPSKCRRDPGLSGMRRRARSRPGCPREFLGQRAAPATAWERAWPG
eukprot:3564358-Lingulodinium_polyedra.AAC.1